MYLISEVNNKMVTQVESESPAELSIHNASQMESKKYIFVKNHVKEINIGHQNTEKEIETTETVAEIKKSSKKIDVIETHSSGRSDHNKDLTEINPDDLDELRSVYKKCKAIISKIESKYGHLLNLDGTGSALRKHKSKDRGYVEECTCGMNKKIIFDDNGEQVISETTSECHSCQKRLKLMDRVEKANVDIEYEETITNLPEDLPSLSSILRRPNISVTFRNKVIKKMKRLKEDYISEVKFNRPLIREILQSSPEEILEFEGSNLFSLPGYPNK